jgi:hypothetical protein
VTRSHREVRQDGLAGLRRAGVAISTVAVLALTATVSSAQFPEPTDADTRRVVDELASDAMKGRGAGSPELENAGRLVRTWLEESGVRPGLESGWLQPFSGPGGVTLHNVVGRIPGNGEECLVIGAHYDGLGIGAPESEFPGEIHNGADDNASGIAALLRVAQRLLEAGDLLRTVYVIGFSGEEIGALGSEHWVSRPPVDLQKAVAMLNLDTVGGLADDRLIVFGTASAVEFPDLLKGVNYGFRFDLAMNQESHTAGDHAPFLTRGIPALHFFTGARPTYHRPGDDPATVNVEGVGKVADFVAEVALYLATTDAPPTFRPAGAERMEASLADRETKRRRVSFGSIPDFSRESGGILLSGVMPGGPAEEAGLRQGDLLVELDGETLDTIVDFQGALAAREPGDRVRVKYLREGQSFECDVVLSERK